MHCYCAVSSKRSYFGSLFSCIAWGKSLITSRKAKIVKILKVRSPPERYATVIFDIDKDGCWPTSNGRVIEISKLKRMHKDEQKKEKQP